MDAGQLFTNLAIAAYIDGSISPQEIEKLKKHAAKLKLPANEAIAIIEAVEKGVLKQIAKPRSPAAREALFKAMADIVRCDKKITPEEQTMLRRIGNILEIDEALMKRLSS